MCFWELAKNNNVQTNLIAEIDAVAREQKTELINFDQLQSMKYLEMFICEILRKYPSLPVGIKVCNKDCYLETKDGELFKFLEGDLIQIPIKLLQNDAKYFPKPETFDPLRFSEFSSNFLAFGLGPRKCLGQQFALLQVKALIFTVMKKFSVGTLENSLEIPPNKQKFVLNFRRFNGENKLLRTF